MAFLTPLTLAGSIICCFITIKHINKILAPVHMKSPHQIMIGGLLMLFLIALAGGGLWGFSIAKIYHRDIVATVKNGALFWGISTSITLISLIGINQVGGLIISNGFSLDITVLYMTVFPLATFLMTVINSYLMLQHMGFRQNSRQSALTLGLLAGVVFLAIALLMHISGWQIGNDALPRPYKMSIVTIICCIGAAGVGGAALGWHLDTSSRRSNSISTPFVNEIL